MADNQNQGNKNAPGRSQDEQNQRTQSRQQQGNPTGRNIMSEDDDANEEGTKMPGRETRTPTAGNTNQQQKASFSSEQGQNESTEQNRTGRQGNQQNQNPNQGI